MALDLKFKTWVLTESRHLSTDWPPGSPREKALLKHWATHRPRMLAALHAQGIAAALAHVLEDRAYKALRENLKAGMPPTDAREQAERDWLIQEPEAEEDEDPTAPLASLPEGPTTT